MIDFSEINGEDLFIWERIGSHRPMDGTSTDLVPANELECSLESGRLGSWAGVVREPTVGKILYTLFLFLIQTYAT